MVKKIILAAVGILLLFACILGYQYSKSLRYEQKDIWQVVHPNTMLVASSNNFHTIWEKLNHSSLLFQELLLIDEVKQTNAFFEQIDSCAKVHAELKDFIRNGQFLLTINPSGSEKANLQVAAQFKEIPTIEQFNNFFGDEFELINTKSYSESTIYEVNWLNKHLFIVFHDDLMLCSPSVLILEETIRNLSIDQPLRTDKALEEIKQTAGQFAKANVYINHKQLGWLLKGKMANNYHKWANCAAHLGNWSALDLDLKSNSLILNGFTNAADTTAHFLSLFNEQQPQELSLKHLAPSNTSLLLNMGVSSFTDYLDAYRNWLDKQGELFAYRKQLKAINNQYGAQTTALAITWIENEVGVFYTEMTDKKQIAQHKILVFKARNILNAQRDLQIISERAGVAEQSSTYRNNTIHALGVNNLYGKLMGSAFSGIRTPYYTTIDDYVLIANSMAALRDVITKHLVKKTLANDEAFKDFNNNLNSESNILLYGNIAASIPHLQAFFGVEVSQWMEKEAAHLGNFQSCAIEWTKEKKNLFYHHAVLNYNPSYKQETGSLWELTVEGAKLTTKPVFVKNHYTGNKEVLVQDDAFNLYLISNIGKQLWKKQLKEKIIGEPVQIDAYKNNKLQYVFVTKNQLHLVDRNGHDVEGFPKTLLARATTPLTVLDYDKNRNYRLLVGCEDGKVYNYTALGEIVDGWSFTNGKSAITGVIKHFTIGKKDYIFIAEQNGKIHLVNRRGESRHQVNEQIKDPSPANPYQIVVGKNIETTAVFYTTRSGKVVKQQFNNEHLLLDLNLPANHLFKMDDVNNDGQLELICTAGDKLIIASRNGEKILEKKFSDTITGFINTYHFPNNVKRVGFTIPAKNEIHLVNVLGEAHEGFPLYGETDFSIADINKEGVFSLVTADSNGKIYTYNLN